MSARRVDAGTLELGGGLELLVAAALEGIPPGADIEVELASRAAALELPAWVRIAGHEVTGERVEGGHSLVRIKRGSFGRELPARGDALVAGDGTVHLDAIRDSLGGPPVEARAEGGLVPLGALVEAGGPGYAWRLNERDRLWADDIVRLTESAAADQWDATTDIPWQEVDGLPTDVERAVGQVMTYIAQNEYAALYVPARFLPQVNPQYAEVLLWLASHVHDEARHVEAFTKRALAGGARAHALASTELSLHTLLEERDFTGSALLLNVLGEGTFLDLLRFVEQHAPDAATAAVARLAHRDERRHVHFGISHVRHRIEADPDTLLALVGAAEARAAKLTSLSGLNPLLTEALTVMSARSLQPAELAEAAAEVRALLVRMDDNRRRRLRAAGFDAPTARHLSELHTPNLM
ncbi:MAG: sulfurtransferase TusA family protein [Gaiellaceae bacterium]